MAPLNFKVTGNLSEEATGEPLANMPVIIQIMNPDGSAGPQLQAVTDASGNYSVSAPAPDPLPTGAYTADATFAGNADEQPADSGPEVAQVGPAATVLTETFNIG